MAGALGAPATIASAVDGRPCPAGAEDGVVTAYADVFSRIAARTADERAARLQGGDRAALRALLDRWLADPVGQSSSITVTGVRCPSRTRAVATTELLLAGTTLPAVIPEGRAVREDGTWKVARTTFCRRMVLEDPTLARAGPCARSAR